MVNAGAMPVSFVVQENARPWSIAIDTSRRSPDDIELAQPRVLPHPSYQVDARSVVVLIRE
jgi:pullulanase/glycogen debranching enzyme